MARYIYFLEAVSDVMESSSYRFGTARSLRVALEWLQTEAARDRNYIAPSHYRSAFRKRSMAKVGDTITNEARRESRYAVYRYANTEGLPATRPAFP